MRCTPPAPVARSSIRRGAILAGLGLCCFAAISAPAQGQAAVTTYVVKVQEEREKTRWTLTEWLRIKERMKMMDVWLAMFSDPKKDAFRPELMLSYGLTRGSFEYRAGSGQTESGGLPGQAAKAQLWLTNLISGTIGVRMLNIDLGAEAYRRQSGDFTAQSQSLAASTSLASASAASVTSRQLTNDYHTGNLRIFGSSIQDSSLVLKYGRYTVRNGILDATIVEGAGKATGIVAGAEIQLYLLRWLGAEGNYLHFGDAQSVQGSAELTGYYHDYQAYIEIALLRLMGGVYEEAWSMERGGQRIQTKERGTIAGVKLQF